MKYVAYPKVGLSHVITSLNDILFMNDLICKRIIINTSAQPNSSPHLGTVTTAMCCFSLASLLKDRYRNKDIIVEFDYLENAPAVFLTNDDNIYSKSLLREASYNGTSLDECLEKFKFIYEELKRLSGIEYHFTSYHSFQQSNYFRENLFKFENHRQEISKIVSPVDCRARIRFECPVCALVDKNSVKTKLLTRNKDNLVYESHCPLHGNYQVSIDKNGNGYVDTNTAIRDVLKGAIMIDRKVNDGDFVIMIDGKDWSGSWFSELYIKSLSFLNSDFYNLPVKLFSPTILDWSGGKFSKSIYINNKEYVKDYLDYYDLVENCEKNNLFHKLYREVCEWVSKPEKFFRDYSVEYINTILKN